MAQPLPPGWEAKYDPGSRRYFFIDHNTQRTSWEDPRLRFNIPIKQNRSRSNSYTEAQNSTSDVDYTMLREIQQDFPTVKEDMIIDVMRSSGGSKQNVERQLRQLGFQQVQSQQGYASNATGAASSPARAAPATSPATATSPTKHVSEAKKKTMMTHFTRKYPDQPESIITMALQACDYDEEKCVRLLQTMCGPSSTQTTQSGGTSISLSGDSAAAASPKRKDKIKDAEAASASPKKKDKKKHKKDKKDKKKARDSASPARRVSPTASGSSSPQHAATPDRAESPVTTEESSYSASPAPSTSTRSSASPPLSQPHSITRTKAAYQPRIHTQQVSGQHISSNHVLAHGPDSSLHVGPNKNLLIDEYVAYQGPNPANVHGPAGAMGPDKTLAQGPCASNYKGPENSNSHGPGGIETSV